MRNLGEHTPFTSVNLVPISVRMGLFVFASVLTSIFFAFTSSFAAAANAARA